MTTRPARLIVPHRPGAAPVTHAEELASALTHGLGAIAAIGATAYMLARAIGHGGADHIAGLAVFGSALVLTYVSSTVFHSMRRPLSRFVWELIDHSAIFVMIAGTYTPFALLVIGGSWGLTIVVLIWSLAGIGIAVRLATHRRDGRAVVPIHLVMGWLAVITIPSLWAAVGAVGFALLLAGGLCYTAGVPVFLADRLPFNHALWHVFCVGGGTCHAAAVLVYCTP